jgi:hypothetical protein
LIRRFSSADLVNLKSNEEKYYVITGEYPRTGYSGMKVSVDIDPIIKWIEIIHDGFAGITDGGRIW